MFYNRILIDRPNDYNQKKMRFSFDWLNILMWTVIIIIIENACLKQFFFPIYCLLYFMLLRTTWGIQYWVVQISSYVTRIPSLVCVLLGFDYFWNSHTQKELSWIRTYYRLFKKQKPPDNCMLGVFCFQTCYYRHKVWYTKRNQGAAKTETQR